MEEKEAHKGKRKPWTLREFGGKTIWDWMGLLIVPVVLSLITVVFAWQQDIRQQRIENQRAAAERELAEQRAQDEALQAYLDQMTQLILDRKLLDAEEGDPVYTLAQARTSTIITSLDAERNRSVTLFLLDSGLTGAQVGAEESSVSVLNDILLEDANLSRAFLLSADLVQAGLSNSDLHNAVLFQANLSDAVVIEANLSEANLNEANLAGAELIDTDLSGASLEGANLGLSNVSGVRADLSSADLSGAYLTDAKVTAEQLDECESLKGATMLNGQKYEDWLKSRGQDGENE